MVRAVMHALAVLAFVSPIFGLRLDMDPALLAATFALPDVVVATTAGLDDAAARDVADDANGADDAAPSTDASAERPVLLAEQVEERPVSAIDPSAVASATDLAPVEDAEVDDVSAQMNRRARLARAHRRLGMATWAAMTATVVTGTLQYANQYGFFAPRAETRCVTGDHPFFGADACVGVPLPHVISTVTTAALYYTTFGLSFAMPDPIGLDRGNSESARALRQHKRMRWIHFTGMALQGVLGAMVANPQLIGLDVANDYRALQALATVHLLTGYATYGLLTYTGARMAF